MITTENLKNHEVIGLKTSIIESTNGQLVGISGTIVDETKSMLVLQIKNGLKKIPKNFSKWKFSVGSKDIVIDGSTLSKRPEDRVRAKL